MKRYCCIEPLILTMSALIFLIRETSGGEVSGKKNLSKVLKTLLMSFFHVERFRRIQENMNHVNHSSSSK